MSYHKIIDKLKEMALQPKEAVIKTMRETGKQLIGCFPIYTPEELVYAAGYIPVGMWGGKTELQLADRYLQSFCCSIMRSNIEYGMKGTSDILKAVIIPTFCDTLKCIVENWKVAVPHVPLIPVVYPQNRKLDGGVQYAQEEFKRVKRELEKLRGYSLRNGELDKAWLLYEDHRATMRRFVEIASDYPEEISNFTRHLIIKSGYFMDKKQHMDDVKNIIEGLEKKIKTDSNTMRVIATGLISEPIEILEILDNENITFVGDDLAHGTRQFRITGRNKGKILHRMSMRIADQRGDSFLFESEKTRGQMLIDMVREKDAKAVVVFMMKFCDPEEFDYPIYKEELEKAGIPILYLEVEQQISSFEQFRTRIQSFRETFM